MKRLLRISVVLGLIVALALEAVATTSMLGARAAETTGTPLEPAASGALCETIKAATNEASKVSVTKVDTNLSLTLTDEPTKISMSTLTDPVSHIVKTTTGTSGSAVEAYSDPASGLVYAYSNTRKCYEFAPLSSSASGSVVSLDSLDASFLEKLVSVSKFSLNSADTLGDKPCSSVCIDIKAGSKQVKAITKKLFGAFESTLGFLKEIMKEFKMDPLDLIVSLEMSIRICFDPTSNLLLGMSFSGILNVDLGMDPIPIVIEGSTTTEFMTGSVTLPPETESAVLAAGLSRKKSGLVFRSVADGANTTFTVSGITKKKAKKLTIPASLSVCGQSYPIRSASQNVFRQATKLKTLIVGDATLKKALIKKPSAYGLKSNINIK